MRCQCGLHTASYDANGMANENGAKLERSTWKLPNWNWAALESRARDYKGYCVGRLAVGRG